MVIVVENGPGERVQDLDEAVYIAQSAYDRGKVFSDYCLHFYCNIHNDSVPPAFFRCFLSNLGASAELRTTSFIQSTCFSCTDSVNSNRVLVLSISVLLLACSYLIASLKLRETTLITVTLCVLLDSSG